MKKLIKKSKKDLMQDGMDLGLGFLGGLGANQLSNFVERQSFIQGHEDLVPAIPAAVGALGYIFLPKQFRAIAFGAFVVGATEGAEHIISKATGVMSGIEQSQLGFVPQYLPGDMAAASVRTAEGISVR